MKTSCKSEVFVAIESLGFVLFCFRFKLVSIPKDYNTDCCIITSKPYFSDSQILLLVSHLGKSLMSRTIQSSLI